MTGSSLSIYTIMFTMSFAMKPFSAIFNVNEAFAQFEHKNVNLNVPKWIYICANSQIIALALYKFAMMGIVPVTPTDWAGLLSPKTPLESSVILWN